MLKPKLFLILLLTGALATDCVLEVEDADGFVKAKEGEKYYIKLVGPEEIRYVVGNHVEDDENTMKLQAIHESDIIRLKNDEIQEFSFTNERRLYAKIGSVKYDVGSTIDELTSFLEVSNYKLCFVTEKIATRDYVKLAENAFLNANKGKKWIEKSSAIFQAVFRSRLKDQLSSLKVPFSAAKTGEAWVDVKHFIAGLNKQELAIQKKLKNIEMAQSIDAEKIQKQITNHLMKYKVVKTGNNSNFDAEEFMKSLLPNVEKKISKIMKENQLTETVEANQKKVEGYLQESEWNDNFENEEGDDIDELKILTGGKDERDIKNEQLIEECFTKFNTFHHQPAENHDFVEPDYESDEDSLTELWRNKLIDEDFGPYLRNLGWIDAEIKNIVEKFDLSPYENYDSVKLAFGSLCNKLTKEPITYNEQDFENNLLAEEIKILQKAKSMSMTLFECSDRYAQHGLEFTKYEKQTKQFPLDHTLICFHEIPIQELECEAIKNHASVEVVSMNVEAAFSSVGVSRLWKDLRKTQKITLYMCLHGNQTSIGHHAVNSWIALFGYIKVELRVKEIVIINTACDSGDFTSHLEDLSKEFDRFIYIASTCPREDALAMGSEYYPILNENENILFSNPMMFPVIQQYISTDQLSVLEILPVARYVQNATKFTFGNLDHLTSKKHNELFSGGKERTCHSQFHTHVLNGVDVTIKEWFGKWEPIFVSRYIGTKIGNKIKYFFALKMAERHFPKSQIFAVDPKSWEVDSEVHLLRGSADNHEWFSAHIGEDKAIKNTKEENFQYFDFHLRF